jgi:hypothetical protein
MKRALDAGVAGRGNAQGVQNRDGATAKDTALMKSAIDSSKSARGQEIGVRQDDSGVHLTPVQQKAFKDGIRNPAVNTDDQDDIKATFKPIIDDAKKSAGRPDPMVKALEKLLKDPKPPK